MAADQCARNHAGRRTDGQRHYPSLAWKSIVEPEILSVLLVVPEQMSATALLTYLEHLRSNKQQTNAMRSP